MAVKEPDNGLLTNMAPNEMIHFDVVSPDDLLDT